MRILITVVLFGSLAWAQQPEAPKPVSATTSPKVASGTLVDVPAGTKIPLVLKHAISTKNARENDNVYAQTNFPVVQDGHIVIPPGTYVQGVIKHVQRAGRVKGKAELLVYFKSMIFPSGYTVLLPGAVDNVPGGETSHVKDQEGTMEGEGSKGKDAGTVARGAEVGTVIGGVATRSMKGVGIGGLAGAAAGLGSVLLTRGPDVRLESGTSVELVLERDIVVDRSRIGN
jgi:hypothetical protein